MLFNVPRFQNFHNFRYVALFVIWFDQLAMYMCRVNLSPGIIGIANYFTEVKQVELSAQQKSLGLSAFNIGYLIMHVFGAYLCLIIGSRAVMMISLALTCLLTFLSVPALFISFETLVVVRALVGGACATLLPIVQQFNSNYSSPTETTRFVLIAMTGNIASLVVMFPIGGYLVENFKSGWQWCFYISGIFTFISLILHYIFIFDYPSDNPWMSNVEQDKLSKEKYPNGPPPRKTTRNYPYLKIFRSPVIYILMSAHFGKLLITNMNLFGLVTFYREFFKLSAFHSGVYAIIPFMLDFFVHFAYDIFSKWLKKFMNNTNVRRLNTLIGSVGCSSVLLGLAFVSPQQVALGITVSSLGMILIPAFQAGYFSAIIESAPQCLLVTMAYINVAGSLSGVLQVNLTGYLKKLLDSKELAYKYSFIITSLTSFAFSMVFVVFGTAERQPWDSPLSTNQIAMEEVQITQKGEESNKSEESAESEDCEELDGSTEAVA